MKKMNSLEAQLHSLQPRPPSAALKRQLFVTPAGLAPKMAWFVGWLVPATACALLTFSILDSGNAISGRLSRGEPMAATMLSNQGFRVPAPDSPWQGQNYLSSVIFDWTNHSGSTSSITSFPRNRVN
jgi:hypothetical protein